MPNNRLFFIDFDNTIFSHRTNSIPESALQALSNLQKTGKGKVILSTGRPMEPKDLAGFFDERFQPDGVIGANAQYVVFGDRILRREYMEHGLKTRLMAFAQQRRYCLTCTWQGTWYISEPEYLQCVLGRKIDDMPWAKKEEFPTLLDKDVYSFFMHAPEEALTDTEQHFSEIEILRMGSELGGGDIVPRGISKSSGMKLIAEYLDCPIADTVAIGDSMNDFAMIRDAGLGIAMGNADRQVRDAADYVTADIDEGGLAQAVSYALACHPETVPVHHAASG